MDKRRGLAAGLTGALAMQIWWLLVPPGLSQVIENRILGQVPGALFSTLLDRLQFTGKPLLYVILLLLQVAAGTALGLLLVRVAGRRTGMRLAAGVGVGVLGWIVASLLFGVGTDAVAIVVGFLIYGAVAALALPMFEPVRADPGPAAPDFSPSRRRMLGNVVAGGLAVLTAGGAVDTIARIGERGTAPVAAAATAAAVPTLPRPSRAAVGDRAVPTASQVSPPNGMTAAITPVASFYVVSKNFVDPTVNAADWALDINGPFATSPLRLTYEQLRAMPTVSQYVTLECISNTVGGSLISNGYWTGVPLKTLLERAGMKTGAKAVAFTCVDGYTESLPLEQALLPTTIVAHTMNGQPLPDKHGFPARIITTGLYGMKNPKWLRTIQPVVDPPVGYWEQQGWAVLAPVRTMSRIDVPGIGIAVAERAAFGGIAFAGNRGISKVEVSFDQGSTWLPAKLEKPLGPDTWVLWYGGYKFAGSGSATALVRATDGSGRLQFPEPASPYPAGAAGYWQTEFRVT